MGPAKPSDEHGPSRTTRLALFLNLPIREVDGELTARYAHLFDFFAALAERTRETTFVLPLAHDADRREDYGTVDLPANVRLAGLPHWTSAPMLARRIHRIVPSVLWVGARQGGSWDALGAVVPSVAGNLLVYTARARRRPVFLFVRGEKQRTVSMIFGASRRTRLMVRALAAMERPVRRWIAAGVPAFVAGEELVERYATPGALLYNLYPGLSRDFPIVPAPRTAWAPAQAPLRLITVARLSPEKGLEDLLTAVASAGGAGADLAVELVGDGPDRERLEALAGELGITDRVRFAGFVGTRPDLVERLDAADVFVLPSRSEGLPHSVVEAMARGLPVVASAIGGLPELLGEGSGIIVPPRDPDALAAVLVDLAADRAKLDDLSARSVARVARFEPDAQARELCERLVGAYPQLGALL
jgi:glycosyltransferase involved in cell wall biosynthesis